MIFINFRILTMENKVLLIDNMEYMKTVYDKYFDLAIVDPPYGEKCNINGGRKFSKMYRKNGSNWNNLTPDKNYFDELFRVSKNQIIWGANYFLMPVCREFIVWDKKQPEGVSFSMAEFAWTSFNAGSKIFRKQSTGFNRIHPTQKPIALYKWLLDNYANQGDKIFDSHVGSGSSRIACYDYGFDFIGCEIDKDYFESQELRFNNHIAQLKLF